MPFTLPKLNLKNPDGLAPTISEETIKYHHGKHHQAYIDNLNKLIEGTDYANKTLEEIVRTSSGPIYNNAAQVWNHNFYWEGLTDDHRTDYSEDLVNAFFRDFEITYKFKEKFIESAMKVFGSGWTWLVKNKDGHLEIINTSNADNPLKMEGKIPLLTCDVWEHAYYIDHRNVRANYLEFFFDSVNWDFVSRNFKKESA